MVDAESLDGAEHGPSNAEEPRGSVFRSHGLDPSACVSNLSVEVRRVWTEVLWLFSSREMALARRL